MGAGVNLTFSRGVNILGFLDSFRRKKAANKEKPKGRRQLWELVKKGTSLVDLGRLDEGIAILKQAIQLDPNYATAHINLGFAYAKKGWLDQAIAEHKRAIELDPNDATTHFSLAAAYYGSKHFDLAWKHVRLAEKLGMPTQNIVQFVTMLRKVSRESPEKYLSRDESERQGLRRELKIEKHVGTRKPVEAFERWREGDLIGNRYEILKILKGGMGLVYICLDQKKEFFHAVKTFQDKFLLDEEARKLFVREAETWVRLEKHRNIVQAYWVKNFSGKPCIFLEYVPSSRDGKANLRDYILSLRADLVKALNLAVQFCDGMVHATTQMEGLVHRDIKPENVMITSDMVLKITDFGLVKALGTPKAERIMGTPEYMSPEQFRTMDVDTRSDIYSFGVVLYEMLIGRPPFYISTKNTKERVEFCKMHHLNTVPKNPRLLNFNIPVTLDRLVMKCLEKRPENRYQSFEDLRKVLDDIYFKISGKRVPVHAGPPPEAWELSNKGLSFAQLGRLDEGIAILKRAIELDPNNVGAHINLGFAYLSKRWLDQAIKEYKRAVELDPNNVGAHVTLGTAYLRRGWLDKAITELKRAVELDPSNVEVHVNLGNAYDMKGWTDQAIATYERAIDLDPKNAGAHFNLALAYLNKSWTDQAITELKQAIELDPNYAKPHFYLAVVYYRSSRFDLAWKHMRIAEKLGMPTQYTNQLIAALRSVSREP